ncbi:MAG: hypothetical protein ABI112_10270 [Terracoccus sp.]
MSSNRNTLVRVLHDVGGAAWFGGSLMGAVALNGASGEIKDPTERTRIAANGWGRWAPVNAAAIGAHVIGGIGLLVANRDRVGSQHGVGSSTSVKTALTVAAAATTAYSGYLGAKLATLDDENTTSESGTVPHQSTPKPVANVQQQLRIAQWVTPVLTGLIIALGAQQGEQQKTGEVLTGKAKKAVRHLKR